MGLVDTFAESSFRSVEYLPTISYTSSIGGCSCVQRQGVVQKQRVETRLK